MRYPEYKYVDVAINSLAARNNVQEVQQVPELLRAHPGAFYVTWRRFPVDYLEHWRTTTNDKGRNTVTGYAGPSYADYLPFDFDDADLEMALSCARTFVRYMQVSMEIDLTGVRCSFSGSKGFHVCLSAALFGGWNPSTELVQQQKRLALALANGFEVDPAIYDTNRMLRLNNSLNDKANRYKVPLTTEEFIAAPLEQILEWAQAPRQVQWLQWEDAPVSVTCAGLWRGILESPEPTEKKVTSPSSVFALTGLKQGEGRGNAVFALACEVRKSGGNRAIALEMARLWDSRQAETLGEAELFRVVKNAYKGVAAEGEEGEEITADDILTPKELMVSYTRYIESLKGKRVKTGWPTIDAKLRAIAPGEVVTIMARSGVGKTAAVQNILRNIAHNQNLLTLFVSMEQPAAQVWERYAQMATGLAGGKVEELFDHEESRQDLTDIVLKDLGENTLTCAKSGLSLLQIEQALAAAQEKCGNKVDVLAVDYLGMMNTADQGYSTYEQISNAAKAVKRLALNSNITVFLLCQVGRKAGEDGNTPLSRSSARDSGAIEESADYLIGFYRTGISEEGQVLMGQILKNRKGGGLDVEMDFDHASMRMTERPAATIMVPIGSNGVHKEEKIIIEGKEVKAQLWYSNQ